MQMHEWEKQEVLLDRIEQQTIADCLEYNVFAYEKHEWDNIPGIVPRYVIYLAKYMQGICAACKEFDERETVFSLRTDMQEQVDNTNTAIKDARSLDITEKDEIKQTISTLNKKTDDFRSTYDTFTLEATKLTEKDCFDTYS
jgi:hypothetical protein